MNNKKLTSLFALFLTSALILPVLSLTKPTKAADRNADYFCSLERGKISTIVSGDRGKVNLIDWEKYASFNSVNYSRKSLATLCKQASARLRKYAGMNQLNYISLARLNNRLFVCASNSQGNCVKDNLGYLLPLRSELNSQQFLLGLFNVPNEAVIQGQKLVIDFTKLLETRYKAYNSKSTSYKCVVRGETPVTVVDTPRGEIDLIVWSQNLFARYSPKYRCDEVTSRFQKQARANNLQYISWGTINNSKVICVSDRSGRCQKDGILITLTQQDNPENVLRSLFDLNRPITRSKTVIDLSQKF
ncbi:MAG: COP23 domain-containing protein [Prochloraceae cyanobacterium]|nr:COP23 domain-containing protein [Prochloraceae cyanobacterium]